MHQECTVAKNIWVLKKKMLLLKQGKIFTSIGFPITSRVKPHIKDHLKVKTTSLLRQYIHRLVFLVTVLLVQ